MAETGKTKLTKAFGTFGKKKENEKQFISGILGYLIAGQQVVGVADRPGFVYVRLRDNLSEVIQAYNDSVANVYGLPVFVSRDTTDQTRYIVTSRETSRYPNWQTTSPYAAKHSTQHSFDPNAVGGDIVWVYSQQMMPLLVYPSGTYGASFVMIYQEITWRNSQWQVLGGTGTPNLLVAKPTNNQALMLLVGIGNEGNPWILTGTLFAATITGSAAVTYFLPTPATGTVLAGIRLVSGTSSILWDNIYDLRSFVQ